MRQLAPSKTEGVDPRRAKTAELRIPSAHDLVDAYERCDVGKHPFFQDLAGRPVDLRSIWVLMANLREGISGHFVRWLAHTIERLDDPRVASLLAKQLNDELGNGDAAQIHSRLLDRFIGGLDPWRPTKDGEGEEGDLVRTGRELATVGARPFFADDTYDAIGALMAGEIFAKKMDKCLGDQIRRQDSIARETLTWLILHEQLEVDHADDARALADLVPSEHLLAVRRGAEQQWNALWNFLTGVSEAAARCGRQQ